MTSETLAQNNTPVTGTLADNSAGAIDGLQKNLSTHILESNQQQSDMQGALSSLKENFIELSAKFDVWQSNTEPMLGQAYDTAQTSMTYSTIILAVVGLVLVVAIIFVARNKKEAIAQAKEDIVHEVMNSDEIKHLIQAGLRFGENSESAERERASRDNLQISSSNIATAENTTEDENGTSNVDNHANIEQEKNTDSKGGHDEHQ